MSLLNIGPDIDTLFTLKSAPLKKPSEGARAVAGPEEGSISS